MDGHHIEHIPRHAWHNVLVHLDQVFRDRGKHITDSDAYTPVTARPNEEVALADVALRAIRKSDLVIDQAILVYHIICDPADAEATVTANIDSRLWAQIGATNIV
jgi:hypothetical protein